VALINVGGRKTAAALLAAAVQSKHVNFKT
jgi:hypothetical protein